MVIMAARSLSVFCVLSGTHLGTPAHSTVVATERDTLVLDDDVPQVLVGLTDVHALDGLGRLTGVLVRKTSVHQQSEPKYLQRDTSETEETVKRVQQRGSDGGEKI